MTPWFVTSLRRAATFGAATLWLAATAAVGLAQAPAGPALPPGARVANVVRLWDQAVFIGHDGRLVVQPIVEPTPVVEPGAPIEPAPLETPPLAPAEAGLRLDVGGEAIEAIHSFNVDEFVLVKRSGLLEQRETAEPTEVVKSQALDFAEGVAHVVDGIDRAAIVGTRGRVAFVSSRDWQIVGSTSLPDLQGAPAFSSDFELAAYRTSRGVTVLQVRGEKTLHTIDGLRPSALAVSNRFGLLIVCDEQGVLQAYDLKARAALRLPALANRSPWRWVQFYRDEERLLLVSRDGLAVMLDSLTRDVVRTTILPNAAEALQIGVDLDGNILVVAQDGRIHIEPVRREALHYGATAAPGAKESATAAPGPAPSPSAAPPKPYTEVPVWFATNRRSLLPGERSTFWSLVYVFLQFDFLAVSGLALIAAYFVARTMNDWTVFFKVSALAVVALFILALRASGVFLPASAEGDPGARFTNVVDDRLQWGRCLVSVPTRREIATLPTAGEFLGVRGEEVREKHFILLEAKNAFISDAAIENPNAPEVLLFIHGFNVSFQAAAVRAAQLKVDLGIDGPGFFFSWPSHGREVLYRQDEANAAASAEHLRQAIQEITTNFPNSKVHVLAHSMGTRIVMNVLSSSFKDKSLLDVDSLTLAAPDIDAQVFQKELSAAVAALTPPLTLYASATDRALLLSKTFNGVRRLGDTLPAPIVWAGMETIDATGVNLDFLGHGYYGDSPVVLRDLGEIIKRGTRAEQRRGLVAKSLGPAQYWELHLPESGQP